MGLLKRFFNNTGRPEGLLGKMMLSGMDSPDGVFDLATAFETIYFCQGLKDAFLRCFVF